MKVSLCTTVMNRLHHLKETLPKNLSDNTYHDLEFVVLNYNSKDGVDDWIKSLDKEIESGKLVYYKENKAKSFMPSHSRNVCALMATGDIICNVDADNFTGSEFAKHLVDTFTKNPRTICCSKYRHTSQNASTHGRLALKKSEFIRLGGYNEAFIYGWGAEDDDLLRRCEGAGLEAKPLSDEFMQFIKHHDDERIKYIDFSKLKEKGVVESNLRLQSRRLHESITNTNIEKKDYIVNKGRVWGEASLIKNFKEAVKSGYKPTRFFI